MTRADLRRVMAPPAGSTTGAGIEPDCLPRRNARVPRLSDECRLLLQSVVRPLIRLRWLEREASRLRLHVASDDVDAALRAEGQDVRAVPEAARIGTRIRVLETRLRARYRRPRMSEAALRASFEDHPEDFRIHGGRFMWMIAARSEAEALRARENRRKGAGWRRVAKRYGGAEVPFSLPRAPFGALPGELPKPLERAVFRAQRGGIVGPIRVASTWYLFEVLAISPGRMPSFREARSAVLERARAGARASAQRRLDADLAARYAGDTTCWTALRLRECSG